MVQVFVCLICGDPYIGNKKPGKCPFCGADRKFIKPIEKYVEQTPPKRLSDESKKLCEEALATEIHATNFYQCISDRAERLNIKKMFKALAKIEREHAVILAKILGVQADFNKDAPCTSDAKAMLEQTKGLEDTATKFYAAGAEKAKERRVKQVFKALAQVEADHLMLVDEELKKPQ